MSDPRIPRSAGELAPRAARERLGALGRRLFDADVETLWERDTRTLPRWLQDARRRYRDFAAEHLAPTALAADRDPERADIERLFIAAARDGMQSELLPRPLGSGNPRIVLGSLLFPAALKAEELAAACSGQALALLAHDLGVVPLLLAGQARAIGWQRKIYRAIARGEPALVAFAITEPGAGSDVEETEGAKSARIVTRARRCAGGYRLDGRKCFISAAAHARWYTVFAALEDGGVDSWTCFLLDRAMPGLSIGRSEKKMGQRATDASELVLDDVFVPDARVIGGLGAGWALCRNVLNYSRPAVGAIAVGIARGAFEHAAAFAAETRVGGRLLIERQRVQLDLAEMLLQVQAARALVWQSARYPLPFQAAGAMAKVFCSDVAWRVCNMALDLLGDHGTLHARAVEKAARDARLTQIYEGTNQINRLAIFESQLGAEIAAP